MNSSSVPHMPIPLVAKRREGRTGTKEAIVKSGQTCERRLKRAFRLFDLVPTSLYSRPELFTSCQHLLPAD